LPTDRLHLNRTETELKSDEKTIGLFLTCRIPVELEIWSQCSVRGPGVSLVLQNCE